MSSVRTRGIEALREVAIKNVEDLEKIIIWNENHGIRFFRIPIMFPQVSNPQLFGRPDAKDGTDAEPVGAESAPDGVPPLAGDSNPEIPFTLDLRFARAALARAGRRAREYGHRITSHPSAFVQLGSPRPEVVHQAILDLTVYSKIFRYMGMRPELGTVMVIHAGGAYDDREAALKRFEAVIARLPAKTRQFLCIENDEAWDILELLPISERQRVPLCVDFFHHTINGADRFPIDRKLMRRVVNTWTSRGIKPKCHYSHQEPGKRPGAHSTHIDRIDPHVLALAREFDMDIMLESKGKEENVLRLHERHFDRHLVEGPDRLRIMWTLK